MKYEVTITRTVPVTREETTFFTIEAPEGFDGEQVIEDLVVGALDADEDVEWEVQSEDECVDQDPEYTLDSIEPLSEDDQDVKPDFIYEDNELFFPHEATVAELQAENAELKKALAEKTN